MYAAEYDKIKKQLDEYGVGVHTGKCVDEDGFCSDPVCCPPRNRDIKDLGDGGKWVDTVNRYRNLRAVLEKAFERAAFGKGAARHARGKENFEDQYIIRGATSFGIGGLYFQMGKKLEESINLPGDARINELLDIIIYAAAAVMVTEGAGVK
jgi:hypothetical protein